MAWPTIDATILAAGGRVSEPPGAGLMMILIVVAIVVAFGMTVLVFVRNRRPERSPDERPDEPARRDHPG